LLLMKRMDLQLASGFRISGIVDEVHGLKKGGMRRLAEDGNTARAVGHQRAQDPINGRAIHP
jgi:hypothetical protein